MPTLNNWWYDRTKFVAQVGLPASGTLYVALAAIWGLPGPEQVSATVLAVDTFLGAFLLISSAQYKNSDSVAPQGYLTQTGVDEDTGMPQLKMIITAMPEDLLAKDVVRLKVGDPPPTVAS